MGGHVRYAVSGGAPLSPKINWFFRDAGIDPGRLRTDRDLGSELRQPPGPEQHRVCGVPAPGHRSENRIRRKILIKGRGVMKEYWNNPSATAEVLKDTWFTTGDIGVIEPGGTLKITDRKKDLIVTAGGKNVAPAVLEDRLRAHPGLAVHRRRRPGRHRRAHHPRRRDARPGPRTTACSADDGPGPDDEAVLARSCRRPSTTRTPP